MASVDDADATRPSLLLRLRDPRDADSWRLFVDLYGPLIQRFARQRGLQEADAADISQDVLSQVARSIRSFEYDRERGRFRDWLGTVVRHRIYRFLKQSAGKAHGVGDDWMDELPATEQDGEWADAFNSHVLRTALDRIRPHFEDKTWEAFRLAWLDQVPAAATAERVGMPIAGVYLAKSRVLNRLREEVTLLADDFPIEPA